MTNETASTAAVRMWLDPPNLMASYERRGIAIITVGLRREAATAATKKLAEMISDLRAANYGDPARLETLSEIAAMAREVLGGSSGQVLPLDLNSNSLFDKMFGAAS